MKKTKRKSSVMEITLDFGVLGELEVEVDYVYTPGERATMYTANGDPGDPGSDPEVEILAVYYKGERITWMFDDDSMVVDAVLENHEEDEPECDDPRGED